MKEMTDPSGFVQAILITSTTLLVVTAAFLVYLASSKELTKGKTKNVRNLMRLSLITTSVGGILAIIFSLTWFFTASNSIFSENQLWAIWISFAIQFSGFIVTGIGFLVYTRLI